jgi:hypothetical protein
MPTPKPDWAISITRTPEVVVLQFARTAALPIALQNAIQTVEGLKTVIHELYMNSDYTYVVGIGEKRETILVRIPRLPDENCGPAQLVLLPASEFEERAPLDLVTEAIHSNAWD